MENMLTLCIVVLSQSVDQSVKTHLYNAVFSAQLYASNHFCFSQERFEHLIISVIAKTFYEKVRYNRNFCRISNFQLSAFIFFKRVAHIHDSKSSKNSTAVMQQIHRNAHYIIKGNCSVRS